MTRVHEVPEFKKLWHDVIASGILTAHSFIRGLEFDIPGKGLCIFNGPSKQGSFVGIFESLSGSEVFHYNIVDAVYYNVYDNKKQFPVGEIVNLYIDNVNVKSKFLIVAKQQDLDRYYLMRITNIDMDNFFLYTEEQLAEAIDISDSRPDTIFDWIKSLDPKRKWTFSDPEILEKELIENIKTSGRLDLKSLIYLILSNYDSIPLLGVDFSGVDDTIACYDKWASWAEESD